jgi:hypothetical protein
MKKKNKNHSPSTLLERVFRITRKDNEIDLTGSVAIINGEASEENFETEVYQVTFTTGKLERKKQYSIFMSPSESIPKHEVDNLKKQLGIKISGDGSLFKIEDFTSDFKLSFDLHNSISIDNLGIKKGVIVFRKNETTRKEVELPFRKKQRKKPILKTE